MDHRTSILPMCFSTFERAMPVGRECSTNGPGHNEVSVPVSLNRRPMSISYLPAKVAA